MYTPRLVADQRRREHVDRERQGRARVREKADLEERLGQLRRLQTLLPMAESLHSKRWRQKKYVSWLDFLGRFHERDAPNVSMISRGPRQYTTRFLQTAHTRHHTMLSPTMTWGSCFCQRRSEKNRRAAGPTYIYTKGGGHHPRVLQNVAFERVDVRVGVCVGEEACLRPRDEATDASDVTRQRGHEQRCRSVQQQGAW